MNSNAIRKAYLPLTNCDLDQIAQSGQCFRWAMIAPGEYIVHDGHDQALLMVARAKVRYAVNAAGRKHLKDLVQRKKATNASLSAELHIASMRNDLGYFQTSPTKTFTGVEVFRSAPKVVKGRVLKSSSMSPLTGAGAMSKGFLVKFSSGHVGMVQRHEGSSSHNTVTARGKPRWRNKAGQVEKLVTMGSPSATAMHNTIWPEVEPSVEEYLHNRLNEQVQKVLARAGKA